MGKTASNMHQDVLRGGALSSTLPLHKTTMRRGVGRQAVLRRAGLRHGDRTLLPVTRAYPRSTRRARIPYPQVAVAPACPPEQQPSAWNSCTDVYDVFAEAVTRPFAEDAVRLVHMPPG